MRDEKGRFIKGHSVSEEIRKKFSEYAKGTKKHTQNHSEETKKKISESKLGKFKGTENPNWKGGTSRNYKTGYYSREYIIWRIAVFTRDNYTCQKCGANGNKKYLTAHHIKSFAHYPELRFEVDNGETLCEDCHKETDNYKGRNCK